MKFTMGELTKTQGRVKSSLTLFFPLVFFFDVVNQFFT